MGTRTGTLALMPPVEPMLARLIRELPLGDVVCEPKWDGFDGADPTRQTVAPNSLRGDPGGPAATSVTWDELEAACRRGRADRLRFTGYDVRRRLDRYGDLFEPLR